MERQRYAWPGPSARPSSWCIDTFQATMGWRSAAPCAPRPTRGCARGPWPTPIRNASGLNVVEDRVELCVIHMKGVVVTLEPVAVVEVQCQGLVHTHGREVPHRSLIRQTKDLCKESCRCFLVVCRYNGVVQCDRHTTPPELCDLPWHHAACPCSAAS